MAGDTGRDLGHRTDGEGSKRGPQCYDEKGNGKRPIAGCLNPMFTTSQKYRAPIHLSQAGFSDLSQASTQPKKNLLTNECNSHQESHLGHAHLEYETRKVILTLVTIWSLWKSPSLQVLCLVYILQNSYSFPEAGKQGPTNININSVTSEPVFPKPVLRAHWTYPHFCFIPEHLIPAIRCVKHLAVVPRTGIKSKKCGSVQTALGNTGLDHETACEIKTKKNTRKQNENIFSNKVIS